MRVLLLYPLFLIILVFWQNNRTDWLFLLSGANYSSSYSASKLGVSLVDRNAQFETEADWNWADVVIISGWLSKTDMLHLIREAKRAANGSGGWPYVTSVPKQLRKQG